MTYKRKEDLTVSIKNNCRCKSCANTGSNHPSYGKPVSEERKRKMSERMSGSNNPRYGKPCPDDVKKALREANIGRKPINIEKRKGKTLEEIYGVERAEEIREKARKYPRTPESNEKRRKSCILAGCGFANKGRTPSDETRQKMRLSFIEKLQKTNNKFHPPYNKKACEYFDKLMEDNKGIYIQHALNGGEFHIEELGFWLDGYDAVNNIAYEFDELKHHYKNGQLLDKDIKRQQLIQEQLGCSFVRIKETDVIK